MVYSFEGISDFGGLVCTEWLRLCVMVKRLYYSDIFASRASGSGTTCSYHQLPVKYCNSTLLHHTIYL